MWKRDGVWPWVLAWKGDLGGIWCLVFPCVVLSYLALVHHTGGSRYTEEVSSSLVWLLSGTLLCLALLLRGLNLMSLSACMNRAHTQICIMKINIWV